jgi:hypothetical protein
MKPRGQLMDHVINTDSLFRRSHLNNVQFKKIDKTWGPSFRTEILDCLPMDKIRSLYCQNNGRPTKELRAITGAIILQNLFNLSGIETCDNFTFNLLWHEALNLGSLEIKDLSICPKTLWNHS